MLAHRDRRATPPCVKSRPPLRGRPEKPAGRRRLLARSVSYASAPRSLPAGFSGRSRPLPVMSPDPSVAFGNSLDRMER